VDDENSNSAFVSQNKSSYIFLMVSTLHPRPFRIFSGASSEALGSNICSHLGSTLGASMLSQFADGETRFEIKENVRGMDVYVVQSTYNPVNHHLMEMLVMCDAFKRASVRSICAVVPYYGYSRQDRKPSPRSPITARLVADLIQVAGFNRLISVDLHAGQIQGFFNFPVDHLFSMGVLFQGIKESLAGREDLTIVSPDAGGTERARVMAKFFNAPLAIVDKRREAPGKAKAMNLIGDIAGRTALLVDDMIDTAGTLVEAATLMKAQGAREVWACASHGVFSGSALEKLASPALDKVVVTDTIPLKEGFKKLSKLQVVTIAPLIAETILRIQRNDSVSALLE
jgi:ribose-phosphate pyrophosphokinase